MPFNAANVVASVELAIAFVGAILLWRVLLSPAVRAGRSSPALPRWDATVADFIIFLVFVVAGAFFAAAAGGMLARTLGLRGDAMTVFTGSAAQLGMLGGVATCWMQPGRGRPAPPPGGPGILVSGATTFLISLPLLLIAAKLSELAVRALGLPTERQSLIAMFANADSPLLLAFMIVLAVVVAPLTEELVFRAGLFRFLRSRIPRWAALAVSAVLFASLHVNWATLEGLTSFLPLAVLAVMFSLAYEQTGKIGTAIVAHALFNLNTIVLIFAGVGI